MSAFFGSPVRASFLIHASEKDQTNPFHCGAKAADQPAMNKPSSLGSKSQAKGGNKTGSLLKKGTGQRLEENDELATTSDGMAEYAGADGGEQSARERSSFDGGSVDQRSLAMSTEFFDAEEALESASDISTQPDDSLGLRERLQHEIRARVVAQEALAALQAERNELLKRLAQTESKEGAAAERPSETETEPLGIRAADESLADAADVHLTKGGGPAGESLGSIEGSQALGASDVVGGSTVENVVDESGAGVRESGFASERIGAESDGVESSAGTANPLEMQDGGPETSVPSTEGSVRAGGGQGPPEIEAGPSGAEKLKSAFTVLGGKEKVVAEREPGGWKEALEKKDLEIARLREKLAYWDRVNEEYRVQREEAKEKKREARRRAQRQRAWTAGLLGGAAALCIVGGAVYGAYWYWEGDWPFLGAGSAEKSSTSESSPSFIGQDEVGSSRVDS